MQHLLFSIILLWINNAVGSDSIYDIIRNDLMHFNRTCTTCNVSCTEDPFDSCIRPNSCSCGSDCSQFGTCCLDSQYIPKAPVKISSKCIPISSNRGKYRGYFMIDRCPLNRDGDPDLERLCQEEWNEEDNPEMKVPVTSLSSQITYKNLYCFRCNEAAQDYYYWPVKLENYVEKYTKKDDDKAFFVKYHRANKTWVAYLTDGPGIEIPVSFKVLKPDQQNPPVTECDPNIIYHCLKSWMDKDTRDKCEAYMDVFRTRKWNSKLYKNVHCALCNSEDVSPFCYEGGGGSGGGDSGGGGGYIGNGFNILLNFNTNIKNAKNCNDGYWYDRPFDKCRRLIKKA